MPYVFEIQDPTTGQWLVKAEGEEARELIERAGHKLDLRATVDEDGEFTGIVSDNPVDGDAEAARQEGRRVVLARFRQATS